MDSRDIFNQIVHNISNSHSMLYDNINVFLKSYSKNDFRKKRYRSIGKVVLVLLQFLEETGVKKGDKILISLDNSIDLIALDMACLIGGYVSVIIFPEMSQDNISHIVGEIDPVIAFAKNQEVEEKFIQGGMTCPIQRIFDKTHYNEDYQSILYIADELYADFVNLEFDIDCSQIFTIVYTSGTSGKPKGVMLTYDNIAYQVKVSADLFKVNEDDKAFAFLPIAHVYQRMITYFCLYRNTEIYLIDNPKEIANYLKQVNPSILVTVPRLLEKVYLQIWAKVEKMSPMKRVLFKMILSTAKSPKPNKFFMVLYRPIYRSIAKKVGTNLRLIISGGAKLDDNVYRFLSNINLPLYQGYGMTEYSPVIASNYPKGHKVCTVGKVFGNETKVLIYNGELIVRGPSMMKGYYNHDPEFGFARMNDQHWVQTGDLASIDKDGFITIIGRVKSQFKTSNGKYVNPETLESLLTKIPGVEFACVLGENRPFLSAILYPTSEKNLPEVWNYIEKMNVKLNRHERIRKYYVSHVEASVTVGDVTPSNKIVRKFVEQRFAHIIHNFYHD